MLIISKVMNDHYIGDNQMFTGIIEDVGTVKGIQRGAKSVILSISSAKIVEGVRIGDSIAVNGICLTATTVSGDAFTADVMPETMKRTSLGELKPGSSVNLERAMPADGRFGGHIVSGHIDGTGVIKDITREDNAVWYTIGADNAILKYIVEKGSIAIDGISLTVAYVDDNVFKVSIIPHTLKETILGMKKIGDKVNLENDIIGKYVEKLLSFKTETKSSKGVDMSTLMENGFI